LHSPPAIGRTLEFLPIPPKKKWRARPERFSADDKRPEFSKQFYEIIENQ